MRAGPTGGHAWWEVGTPEVSERVGTGTGAAHEAVESMRPRETEAGRVMADDRGKGNDFLVVGRAGMDFYPDPPGTKTEDGGRWISLRWAGRRRTPASQIVKLGAAPDLVTCVSDDAIGRYALQPA